MTIATAPAAERLAAFRTHHRIEVDHSPDWNRCDTCGIRVYQVVTRRWQHDMNEVRQLEQEEARVADVIAIASARLRRFEYKPELPSPDPLLLNTSPESKAQRRERGR